MVNMEIVNNEQCVAGVTILCCGGAQHTHH
nr:MAG TPA: hypothetical protein [Caudoviricetes sp.]